MQTFKEFLLEREMAGLYVSQNQRLFVLGDLIEKEFGVHFKDLAGGCLASQFLFTLSAISGIKPQALVDKVKVKGEWNGTTLQALFKLYDNKDIKLPDGRSVKFKLSVESYTTAEAVAAVKSGQPVVAVVPSYLASGVDWKLPKSKILQKDDVRAYGDVNNHNQFHAWLLIGYDADEKTLIFREARDQYAAGGYIKIRERDIKANTIKWIATIVDSFKITDAPKTDKNDSAYADAA